MTDQDRIRKLLMEQMELLKERTKKANTSVLAKLSGALGYLAQAYLANCKGGACMEQDRIRELLTEQVELLSEKSKEADTSELGKLSEAMAYLTQTYLVDYNLPS